MRGAGKRPCVRRYDTKCAQQLCAINLICVQRASVARTDTHKWVEVADGGGGGRRTINARSAELAVCLCNAQLCIFVRVNMLQGDRAESTRLKLVGMCCVANLITHGVCTEAVKPVPERICVLHFAGAVCGLRDAVHPPHARCMICVITSAVCVRA